ncbi:MAG: hypothetical protein ABUL60_10755 [Myxococcales bacterium]
MLIKASRFYGIGLTLAAIGAVAACSSDSTDTPGTGTAGTTSHAGTGTGTAGTGTGTAGTGTGTGGTGTGTAGTGTGTAGTGGAATGACAKVTAPLITQFEDLMPNPTSAGQFVFTAGVPGGTFAYQPGALTVTDMSKSLNIKGSIAAYDGFGVYFNACADASAYTGVSFNIKGKPGATGMLNFRVQTDANTAVDTVNKKGTCMVPAGTTDTYPLCHASAVDIPVTEAGGVVEVKFASLTGGVPVETVTGKDVVGLEWAFTFTPAAAGGAGGGGSGGASGYPVDITVDDIKFTGGPAGGGTGAGGSSAGGSGGAAAGSGGAAAGSGGAAAGSGGAAAGSGGSGGTQ